MKEIRGYFQSESFQVISILGDDFLIAASCGSNVTVVAIDKIIQELFTITPSSKTSGNYTVTDISWNRLKFGSIGISSTNGVVSVYDCEQSSKSVISSRSTWETAIESSRSVHKICWHPTDASVLAAAYQDGVIRLYDIRTDGSKTSQEFFPRSEGLRDIQFSPFAFDQFAAISDNGTLSVWDKRKPDVACGKVVAHTFSGLSIAYHPNKENIVATGGKDKNLKLWNLSHLDDGGEPIHPSPLSQNINTNDEIRKISVNSANHERYLLSKPVMVLKTPGPVARIRWRGGSQTRFESQVATCTRDRAEICVWNLNTPHMPVCTLSAHSDACTDFLWLDTPAPGFFPRWRHSPSEHSSEKSGLDLMQHIVSCGRDGKLIVCDLRQSHFPRQDAFSNVVGLSYTGNVAFHRSKIIKGDLLGLISNELTSQTSPLFADKSDQFALPFSSSPVILNITNDISPESLYRLPFLHSPQSSNSLSSLLMTPKSSRSRTIIRSRSYTSLNTGPTHTSPNANSTISASPPDPDTRTNRKQLVELSKNIHSRPIYWKPISKGSNISKPIMRRNISSGTAQSAISGRSEEKEGHNMMNTPVSTVSGKNLRKLFSVYDSFPGLGLVSNDSKDLHHSEDSMNRSSRHSGSPSIGTYNINTSGVVFVGITNIDSLETAKAIRQEREGAEGSKSDPAVMRLLAQAYTHGGWGGGLTPRESCEHNFRIAHDAGFLCRAGVWWTLLTLIPDFVGGTTPTSSSTTSGLSFTTSLIGDLLLDLLEVGDCQHFVIACEILLHTDRISDPSLPVTASDFQDVSTSKGFLADCLACAGIPFSRRLEAYYTYIELLRRFKLFAVANLIIKQTDMSSSSFLDQHGVQVYLSCSICGKELPERTAAPWCAKCHRMVGLCAVCHEPVRGLLRWCAVCGHGGHHDCTERWFKTCNHCPTGCEHDCNALG